MAVEAVSVFGRIVHPDDTVTFLAPVSGTFAEGRKLVDTMPTVSREDVLDAVINTPLPMKGRVDGVIGWGAFSIATRFIAEASKGPDEWVAVFKPLVDARNIPGEDDRRINNVAKEQIKESLGQYLVPNHSIICDGLGGNPMFVKLSREVAGAPLMDISPIALVANALLCENLEKFYNEVLEHFFRTGSLVDVWGNIGNKITTRLVSEVSPLCSKNMVVEMGSNDLKVVDVSAWAELSRLDAAPTLMRKALIVTRALGLQLFSWGLKGVNYLHRLRSKVFTEKAPTVEEKENFRLGIQDVVQTLEDAGIDYRVVGSVALAGTIQSHGGEYMLNPFRTNGVTRDVDVICFAPRKELRKLGQRFEAKAKTMHGYPEVSLSPTFDTSEAPPKMSPHFRTSYNFLDKDGHFGKKYGDEVVEFSDKDLESHEVELMGVKFKTFSPDVIAGLYLSRGGWFKGKDNQKLRQLYDVTKYRIGANFRDFVTRIRYKYPLSYNLFLMNELAYYVSGGYVSSLKQWVKKMVRYSGPERT